MEIAQSAVTRTMWAGYIAFCVLGWPDLPRSQTSLGVGAAQHSHSEWAVD